MAKLDLIYRALCPYCQTVFDLPPKSHQIEARVACPHCRSRLIVQLGVHGVQQAEWVMK